MSYPKTKPVTQSDSTITYGTSGKKSRFSQMHFKNSNKIFDTGLPAAASDIYCRDEIEIFLPPILG